MSLQGSLYREFTVVWEYSKTNITNIRKSLSQINWVNALKDLNVNDQVDYLTNCI